MTPMTGIDRPLLRGLIGLARVQHCVIVTAHLATGQHLSIEPVHRLSDDFQVRGPVLAVAVVRLTAVATRGDVVDGTGKLDAQGAGDVGIVAGWEARGKT